MRENLFRIGALSRSFMHQDSSVADLGPRTFSTAEGISEVDEEPEVVEARVEVRERLLRGASSEDADVDEDGSGENGEFQKGFFCCRVGFEFHCGI